MAQFDVYRNPNPESRGRIPFLLDVQSELLDPLVTRIVVPLGRPQVLRGRAAERLNPIFEIEGKKVVMLTPELAGIPSSTLGERVCSLSSERASIIAALDMVFSGI